MTTTTTNYNFLKYNSGETPWSHSSGLDAIDSELAKPRIIYTSPTVGATTTCDLSLSRAFKFTVSQATTLAFTNVPSSSFFVVIYLYITNGNAFVLTWPASVTFTTETNPILKTSGNDIIKLITVDGGTTWRGALIEGTERPESHIGTDVTQTVSGGGSPATLKTYSLQAGKMSLSNMAVRIRAWGTTANNVNAKAVRLSFGATIVQSLTLTPSTAAAWQIEAWVYRTGATTQKGFGQVSFHGAAGSTGVLISGPNETMANAITIKLDCTQIAGGDVIAEGLIVEFLN